MRKINTIICFSLLCSISLLAKTYSGGSGTSSNPYRISSMADWENLAQSVLAQNTQAGKHFILTTDLYDCQTIVAPPNYTPNSSTIYYFEGNFDGDGHNIEVNFNVARKGSYLSLKGTGFGVFGNIRNASIKNLSVSGSMYNERGGYYTGGICGTAESSTISDCVSRANIVIDNTGYPGAKDARAGGICGLSTNTNILRCYSIGNMSIDGFPEGLTPYSYDFTSFGGIVCYGDKNGSIRNCFSLIDKITTKSPAANTKFWRIASADVIRNCFSLNGTDDNPSGKDGHGKTSDFFKNQFILEYLLEWDFTNVWEMSKEQSDFNGYPKLRNIKYPKQITVNPQIGKLISGAAGTVYFPVKSTNIVNDRLYSTFINDAPVGVSSSTIRLENNTGVLSVSITETTPAGTYPIKINLDNTESNVFELVIEEISSVGDVFDSDPIVSRQYYTLSGITEQQPIRGSVYIVKQLHQSGNISVRKMMCPIEH